MRTFISAGLLLSALLIGCGSDTPTLAPTNEAASTAPAENEPEAPPSEAPPSTAPISDPVQTIIDDPNATPAVLGDPVEVELMEALDSGKDATLGAGTSVGLIPEPVLPSRERRRMDIDQLNATLLQVSGGHTWTIGNKNQFVELARTLGKPDYLDLTNEDLEASALFAKFLDDASRSVCSVMVDSDLASSATDPVLMIHADADDTLDTNSSAIALNIQTLVLRFHGRRIELDGPQMETWRWLWTSAEHVSQDPVAAWMTVCIGLINHPDFFTY
ncbi:MAG: hypothetical protein ACI9OJ_005058 [Myxococcota bacterium]|jgi:hypothetical protein